MKNDFLDNVDKTATTDLGSIKIRKNLKKAMTCRDLIELCLTMPLAYEDYPFDDTTPVIRHSGNKKIFAFIIVRNEKISINLKCNPSKADFLRQIYADVTPGWHMNKDHWNTVYIGGDVPEHELAQMIEHSYDLIKPKPRKRELQEEK